MDPDQPPPDQVPNWYLSRDGHQHGPLSEAQVRSLHQRGRVLPTDYLWNAKVGRWVTAEEIFGPIDPGLISPPPPSRTVHSVQAGSQLPLAQATASRGASGFFRSGKAIAGLAGAIVTVVAGAAAVFDSNTIKGFFVNTEAQLAKAAANFMISNGLECWGYREFGNVAQFESGTEPRLRFVTIKRHFGSPTTFVHREDDERQERLYYLLQTYIRAGVFQKNISERTEAMGYTGWQRRIVELTITDRNWWTNGKGLCFGSIKVERVLNYTAPSPGPNGTQLVSAHIEWRYVGSPAWVAKWPNENLSQLLKGKIIFNTTSEGYQGLAYQKQ